MARKERDVLLGHSEESDGIEEYDNALPAWWLGLFYFTIAWAVVYGVHYHFVGNRSQAGEYDAEVAAAEARWPKAEVQVVAEVTPEAIAAGAEVYSKNCIPCHGAQLEGGVGPKLTDGEWIHGGTLADITRVVNEGVPEKGMLTWGPILGPEKVAQVSAFVHSKGGGQ